MNLTDCFRSVAFAAMLVCPAAAGASTYHVDVIGNNQVHAEALNAQGQVVGYTYVDGSYHAFLYEQGVRQDLGTFGGTSSYAYAINDQGLIAGHMRDAAGTHHGYTYQDGQVSVIPDMSSVAALGTTGQVLGYPSNSTVPRSAIWFQGQWTDIPSLYGLPTEIIGGRAINASGQVTGYVWPVPGQEEAFLYSAGTTTSIRPPGGGVSFGNDINDLGQVLGLTCNGTGFSGCRGFLYEGGTSQLLPVPPGAYQGSYARINNLGQMTGLASFAGEDRASPFLYDQGQYLYINGLLDAAAVAAGWQIASVGELNDAGQILASGILDGNTSRQYALLLTPVPEPASAALLLAGLVIFAVAVPQCRRRLPA